MSAGENLKASKNETAGSVVDAGGVRAISTSA